MPYASELQESDIFTPTCFHGHIKKRLLKGRVKKNYPYFVERGGGLLIVDNKIHNVNIIYFEISG